jgi:opacity protein-like surface antigen
MVTSGRRLGSVGLAAVVALVLSAGSVMAQTTATVTADLVNLREKPTTESAVVMTVERGAELTVIETAGSWYKVREKSSGKEGYVHSLTVKVTGDTRPAAPPSAAPPRTPAPVAPRPVAPRATGASDDESTSIVPMAGLITGSGTTTWLVGAGVGFKPFSNPGIRIQADVLFHRFSEHAPAGLAGDLKLTANAFWISANGHYLLGGEKIKPYVGAGITVGYATIGCSGTLCSGIPNDALKSSTDVGFQGLGGVDYPIGSLTVRGEARLIIISGSTSFAILGGVRF